MSKLMKNSKVKNAVVVDNKKKIQIMHKDEERNINYFQHNFKNDDEADNYIPAYISNIQKALKGQNNRLISDNQKKINKENKN